VIFANDLDNHVGKTVRMVGDFVTYKPVKTKKGEMMMFGTFLDDEGNFFNTVHFPNSLKGYRFQGMGIYLVEGTVTMEFGYCSITVSQWAKIPLIPDPWEPKVINRKLLP
jgi:DNA polymerase III alpha subunit